MIVQARVLGAEIPALVRLRELCGAQLRSLPPPLGLGPRAERRRSRRHAFQHEAGPLATELAPHLSAPREAKKTLANLFAAPGRIRLNLHTTSVDLAPAATQHEQAAFNAMLKEINRRNLTLPGDPHRRKLRFRCQIL